MCDLSTPREASEWPWASFLKTVSALHRVEGHLEPLLVFVVNNTLLWKEAGLVTCFVGLCAMGKDQYG